MTYASAVRSGFRGFPQVAGLALLLLGTVGAQAAPAAPVLMSIDPAARTVLTNNAVTVTLMGSGFVTDAGQTPTLVISPSGMINFTPVMWASDGTSGTTTFTLTSAAAGMVSVAVRTTGGTSAAQMWDTGIAANDCIEALPTGGCALRWEVDVSGVSGSSSQTSTNNTPNVMTKLDWQYQIGYTKGSKFDKASGKAKTHGTNLLTHGIFEVGYTQVPTANKVQPPSSTGGSSPTPASSNACAPAAGSPSTTTSTIPASCNTATTQQAFVAQLGGTLGATFSQDGSGTFAELGIHVRGSVQDLVQNNQIIQSGGISYPDLSALNPKTVVGLYEATGRFRVASLNHDNVVKTTGKGSNSSSLFLIEAGFQYNSGLAQLASNPQTNTRNRFVGRFYLYPELGGPTHTKGVIGMEFSGGIAGGPKVIQIFWGTNLNPAKLLNPTGTTTGN